ncbi:MAG: zinc-binding dehydrogenase [Chlamydiales bacterium]|nr:2-enoyl thioester reductase domain-containing protein [Chlamydiales bacterium]NCF71446.1 zinc-binding dehydrogenase [Chlamydiales bacterium]
MIYSQLFHESFSEDFATVKIKEKALKPLNQDEVLLKVLYSPINPADLNRIEGKYGIQPPMPAVLGNEGVVEVIEKGAKVSSLSIGDFAIVPLVMDFWSEYMVVKASELIPLPKGIDAKQAAMISVNPATAYRLLKDFQDLKEGDWVVLNAASSAVAHLLIQLIKHFKLHCYCFVRSEKAKDSLIKIGADIVVVEDEKLDLKQLRKDFKGLSRCKLGLNAVGGKSAEYVYKMIGKGASCISYGAMSKKGIMVNFTSLAFRQISFQGFWISQWLKDNPFDEVKSMYDTLAELFVEGVLQIPIHEVYSFREYKDAIKAATTEGRQGKVLLRF